MTSTPTPSGLAPVPFSRATGVDLRSPAGLSVDKGGFWVADTFPGRVHHYAHDGRRLLVIGDGVLREPRDVAVAGDRVYVADSDRGSVEAFTTKGRAPRHHRPRRARAPARGGVDAAARILVSDVGHNRVRGFDATTTARSAEITDGIHIPHGMRGRRRAPCGWSPPAGSTTATAGSPATSPTSRPSRSARASTRSSACMSNPAHVAVDADGLVLVTVPDYGFVSALHAGRGVPRRVRGRGPWTAASAAGDRGHRRVTSTSPTPATAASSPSGAPDEPQQPPGPGPAPSRLPRRAGGGQRLGLPAVEPAAGDGRDPGRAARRARATSSTW